MVDVQREFFKDPATAQSLNRAIEYINAAIELFRSKGLPIVCVQDREEAAGRIPGSEAFALPESLNIRDSDIHITKTYGNSFNKTPLAETLRGMDVDTVIITGYCAEFCVLSTCRGAMDQDFTALLLHGALASGDPRNIEFVERINHGLSFVALKKFLE